MSELSPIGALLAPRSIAVVGASRRPDTIGRQIVHNLLSFGFTGAVYPVNPTAHSICGVKAWPSIASLPEVPDVAIVVVPKQHVLEVAEVCGKAGVKGLVVISAGFREVSAEGKTQELELLRIVRSYGMRMVGPNCMGIINADPAVSMNGTFATAMPPFGHAAFVSQSGALGLSVLDYAREYGIGISQFVSVGNKADVSGNDLLEQWEHDPEVGVILMYVENFGNPKRFLEIAGRITKRKPIIVVKSGRSRAGARAATSHTGALAASDTAVDALLTQAGVLRAGSIEELFDMAMAFEARAQPRSRRTAVLTNAGGPGILAADAMEACGLDLTELAPSTVDALRPLFPPEASIRNPLDMIASATPAGYNAAMKALLADPEIDAVVPIFIPPFGIRAEDVAQAIVNAADTRPDKTVLAVLMGREGLPTGRSELQAAKIPTYIFPESAARALAALNRQRDWSSRPRPDHVPLDNMCQQKARAIISGAKAEQRARLTQEEVFGLLGAYGVCAANARLARTLGDAESIANEIGYPIALKIESPGIVHKSDVGGVRVGIADVAALGNAWREMHERVARDMPNARITGVLVQRMLAPGQETIVGFTRDPSFGPLLMFGLGGLLVEVLQDVVFRLAPVDDAEAARMIGSIHAARLLDGVRGLAAADRRALASVVRRVGQLATDFPELQDLEINPLMAYADRTIAVDARATLSKG